MSCREVNGCRVCGAELGKVLDLGTQCLQGTFPGPDEPDPPRFPLVLGACTRCGLAQLTHTVDPQLLFGAGYGYRSGVTRTMRTHLREAALEAWGLLPNALDSKRVLDIGCNDGTLLSVFPEGWFRVGIDPCGVASVPEGALLLNGFYPQDMMRDAEYDLIFSVACFYDADDPVAFARAVRDNLSPGGVWCCEVADLNALTGKLAYDGICFEHLGYYGKSSFQNVLARAGLELVRVSANGCNGGSLRFYARRDERGGRPWQDHAVATDWELFARRVVLHRSELRAKVASLRDAGKLVHLLGASTKVNTLLQYCDLHGGQIFAASERDPRKHGRRTPGTAIPILVEEESRAQKPDAYLVGPWHFKDEIVARERGAGYRGQLVFPLPRLEVVQL
jgi:hypothetical protein